MCSTIMQFRFKAMPGVMVVTFSSAKLKVMNSSSAKCSCIYKRLTMLNLHAGPNCFH